MVHRILHTYKYHLQKIYYIFLFLAFLFLFPVILYTKNLIIMRFNFKNEFNRLLLQHLKAFSILHLTFACSMTCYFDWL